MLGGGEAPKGQWAHHLHPFPSVISGVVHYRNDITEGYMKEERGKEQGIDYKCLNMSKCGRKKSIKTNDHGNN